MADRPTVTQADRSEIQNRIDQSLNYILNGSGAYWPDGGSRSMYEIVSNLLRYRASLPRTEDVNDPDEVYRSVLLNLDESLKGLQQKIQAAGKFPDDLDVIPPFRDNHMEVQPPSPFSPPLSQKDLLNRFNNPVLFQPDRSAATEGQLDRSPGWQTSDPSQVLSPLQPDTAQGIADSSPTRFLVARSYDPSQGSPFAKPPVPSTLSPDGSFSLNDAYLEHLKRLNAV